VKGKKFVRETNCPKGERCTGNNAECASAGEICEYGQPSAFTNFTISQTHWPTFCLFLLPQTDFHTVQTVHFQ